MPPKRRATRSASKTEKSIVKEEEEEKLEDQTVEEPKPKKTRGRKKKVVDDSEEVKITPVKKTSKSSKSAKSTPGEIEGETDVQIESPVTRKSKELSETKLRKSSLTGTQRVRIPSSPSKRVSMIPSPSKRVSSDILSRIPSPIKRTSSLERRDLASVKLEGLISHAFKTRSIPTLTAIIDDLRYSKPEAFYNEYKIAAEVRFKTADDLVSTLSNQNDILKKELEAAKQRIEELSSRKTDAANESTNKFDGEEQLFENELILDMMEQIVGLRIHKAEDNDEALIFECSQSGKNGILDYKLSIDKEDSSDILYSPIENDDSESLKQTLPDYFFDNLTFPLETLQQFYHKIYRGLNK